MIYTVRYERLSTFFDLKCTRWCTGVRVYAACKQINGIRCEFECGSPSVKDRHAVRAPPRIDNLCYLLARSRDVVVVSVRRYGYFSCRRRLLSCYWPAKKIGAVLDCRVTVSQRIANIHYWM